MDGSSTGCDRRLEDPSSERPRLRGVIHQYATIVFAGLSVALVAAARGPTERVSVAIFGACVVITFGTSALYHRVTWSSAARRVMRRLDHAGVYLLIAGTYTPFGLLVLTGAWRFSILAVVWTGAALAIVQRLIWVDAPKWLAAAVAVGLGWVGVVAFPQILGVVGPAGAVLIVISGVLYTAGAIVYVRGRPDPKPAVFGYHELFHACTILAAASQYAVIAFFVLPA